MSFRKLKSPRIGRFGFKITMGMNDIHFKDVCSVIAYLPRDKIILRNKQDTSGNLIIDIYTDNVNMDRLLNNELTEIFGEK